MGLSLLSALPFLIEFAFGVEEAGQSERPALAGIIGVGETQASEHARVESFVALHNVAGSALKLLCRLLYFQKHWNLALQLLGTHLRGCLEYDAAVCASLRVEPPSTSPLLDLLQIIDQSYVEPSQMPSYLNVAVGARREAQDCTANAWIQRESGDTTFVQVDLLQLARNIRDAATRNGSPADQIQYFVEEGTRWTHQVAAAARVNRSGTSTWLSRPPRRWPSRRAASCCTSICWRRARSSRCCRASPTRRSRCTSRCCRRSSRCWCARTPTSGPT